MTEQKKEAWSDVKNVLSEKEKKELITLIGDLYRLNKDNKTFLHSRYPTGEASLEPYLHQIRDALYPPITGRRRVNFSAGKRVISSYFKATNDIVGKLELMAYYVEMGTKYTVEYGDMWENFYFSLERMFEKITEELDSQPDDIADLFLPRLEKIVTMASGMGWGYYDTLNDLLYEFCDRNEKELSLFD
jgi:hypothetical protein